jgi:hypothetical protein
VELVQVQQDGKAGQDALGAADRGEDAMDVLAGKPSGRVKGGEAASISTVTVRESLAVIEKGSSTKHDEGRLLDLPKGYPDHREQNNLFVTGVSGPGVVVSQLQGC